MRRRIIRGTPQTVGCASMNIRIHRGTHQIGGCVTEYEYGGWRLFVDYGEELPGGPKTGDLQIEGLTDGDLSKSALLVTHYHGDHIGNITKLPKELPIYMGEVTRDIQLELSKHCLRADSAYQEMIDRLEQAKVFKAGAAFSFGKFTITPVTIDHSAFDAYAFKIEADNVSVFHTGDFRTHGFRSKAIPKVMETFVGKVDYLVCEATNVSRPDATSLSEHELQQEYQQLFMENKGNVVYVSSTNIDRLFGLYHAAIRAGRVFIIDEYQKRMMDIVTKRDRTWGKSRLYKFKENQQPTVLSTERGEFWMNDKLKNYLDDKGYVLIARANPRFNRFIANIPGEKQVYLSMWRGYVDEKNAAYNPVLAEAVGKDFMYKHTSGHCDMNQLQDFFSMLRPKAIIPIHTDNPKAFADLFCNQWPVLPLNDGEAISPISCRTFGAVSAKILCFGERDTDISVASADHDDTFWGLEEKWLGDFAKTKDAEFILSHVIYKPEAILGYEITEEGGVSVSKDYIYDSKFELLSSYVNGGHSPGGAHYQEKCRFAVGEKVLAAFRPIYHSIVPATVIGPMTPDIVRKYYQDSDGCSSFEEFQGYWTDWDWDAVVVRPHVRLSCYNIDEMSDTATVSRVLLFPYRDFKASSE